MPGADLRLGVDVGATNTDAVVMDRGDHVLARAKVPSTPEVRGGIAAAIREVVAHAGVDRSRVNRAMLGTTDAASAVVEGRSVSAVGVLRIGSPLTLAVPPLATWPAALREAVSVGEAVVAGGAEYDGRNPTPLDEDAIARFLDRVGARAQGIAITSVFAPVAPEQELAAGTFVRRELGPEVQVSLSHEIGSLGLLERENATVLNATLVGAAEALGTVLLEILRAEGIDAEPFLAQNDGTVMALDHAMRFPVLMTGSGPASSMRGAAYLTGIHDAVVLDVGGASTAAGVLVNGFPRESGSPARIAGVPMGFRMPQVLDVPVGGATVLDLDASPVALGSRPLDGRLAESALVFGGVTATLTDAAVAAGRADIGTRALDAAQRAALVPALEAAGAALADAVDRIGSALESPPVLVVGGAGAVVPDRLDGVHEVIRPADGDVANAIGVATAPVSGQADRICSNRPDRRRRALDEVRAAAFAHAVHAGADPDGVEVVEVEEVPLTYLIDPAIRIRVKAAGPRS